MDGGSEIGAPTRATVSVSFFRFGSVGARSWALAQMGFSRRALRLTDGIGFHKLFGTGTGEGFDPLPNTAVYAIMAVWPSEAVARRQTTTAPVFCRYRRRAAESWTVFLSPTHSRGRWDGGDPFVVQPRREGPIAVLTRASVKPRHLLRFWRNVPDINGAIRAQDHLLFKIGMGEIPWLHQVTFSIWDDRRAMCAFARSGAHGAAVHGVRQGGWFSEELYAHFAVAGHDRGTWEGRCPLPGLTEQA